MKSIRNALVSLFVLGGFVALISLLHAQEMTQDGGVSLTATNDVSALSDFEVELMALEQTTPLPATDAPDAGNFYSTQHLPGSEDEWPPLPANIRNTPVWPLGEGFYLLDDSGVDYDAPQTESLSSRSGLRAMGLSSEDDLGESFSLFNLVSSTNLWLAITNLAGSTAGLMLSNTEADIQYEIQGTTNLTDANWISEGFVLGSEITNWTAASVAATNYPNLFLRVRSWQDSDGSGLPDWWQLQYFGTTGIDPYADPDGDGWNNLEEFLNGTGPAVFNSPSKGVSNVSAVNTVSGTTNTVVSWESPSTSVTSYTVVQTSGTNVTTYTVSGDLSSWTATSAPAGSTYQVVANYPGGSADLSSSADPMFNPLLAIDPEIVRGPDPSSSSLSPLQIVLGGMVPTNVAAIRVHLTNNPAQFRAPVNTGTGSEWLWVWFTPPDNWSVDWPGYTDGGSFDVPLSQFTNGVYQISWAQMPKWGQYYYTLQPVGTDGRGGVITPQNFVRNAPFVDGSAVTKQNLAFEMQAARGGNPADYGVLRFKTTSRYAQASPYLLRQSLSQPAIDELSAFYENYFLRNWSYSAGDVVSGSDGSHTYFEFFAGNNIGSDGVGYTAETVFYEFNGYDFVNNGDSGVLAPQFTNTTPVYLEADIPSQINNHPGNDDLTEAGLAWNGAATQMAGSFTNLFGLAYQKMRVMQIRYPLGTASPTVLDITPGNSLTDADPGYYSEYFQLVSAPVLTTVDYYFGQAGLDVNGYEAGSLPGDASFEVTNATPLIITAVGQSESVYGWAKQQISNGDPTKFGYLGQYFDKAYTTDGSGNATSTQTGILSEYGDFLATAPGKVILKTKADPDQGGMQGQCPVYAVSMNVDANHDGVMDLTYQGPDTTSAGNPFVFWINNDNDSTGQDIEPGNSPDSGNNVIQSTRDLEDFARFWICGMPSIDSLSGYQVRLHWRNYTRQPAIKLFPTYEADGGIGYLTNSTIAQNTLGYSTYGEVSAGADFVFSDLFFLNTGTKHFLFEGVSPGSGELVMTVSQNGTTIAETSVWMTLHDIKDLYEQAHTENIDSVPPSTKTSVFVKDKTLPPNSAEDQQVIAFVHGLNVGNWEYHSESETMFKRLYWQGYHGRFAAFDWPSPLFALIPTGTNEISYLGFNTGEYVSWHSGAALKAYIDDLRSRLPGYTINLAVHSLGNVAANEAIREGAQVDNYALMQAAISAGAFDGDNSALTYDYLAPGASNSPDANTLGGYKNYFTNQCRRVNFYNDDDYALFNGPFHAWEGNQLDYRPDTFIYLGGFQYSYSFDGTNCFYKEYNSIGGLLSSRTLTEDFEKRAYVARSRTKAVGAAGLKYEPFALTGGAITNNISLQDGSLGFIGDAAFGATRPDHSGEFTKTIQNAVPFYKELLKDGFLIVPNP